MNICESDIAIISRKNKLPVLVISRFIILISNRLSVKKLSNMTKLYSYYITNVL